MGRGHPGGRESCTKRFQEYRLVQVGLLGKQPTMLPKDFHDVSKADILLGVIEGEPTSSSKLVLSVMDSGRGIPGRTQKPQGVPMGSILWQQAVP